MDVRWRPPIAVAIVTHLVTQSFVRAQTACWLGTFGLRITRMPDATWLVMPSVQLGIRIQFGTWAFPLSLISSLMLGRQGNAPAGC
jgi:hypothetical protein